MSWWGWGLLIFAAIVALSYYNNKKRREYLMSKYEDEKLVEMLMKRQFWQGQTEGQLLDSLGKPSGISQQVLKTKTKKTWKYHPKAKNRYALKINLENGVVVGWEQK